MTITDPAPLLEDIDVDRLQDLLNAPLKIKTQMLYVEPAMKEMSSGPNQVAPLQQTPQPTDSLKSAAEKMITGKVQTLGDFIDTDALAPAEALIGNLSAEELGKYCLYHTHPDFRRRVKEEKLNVVVAGNAFGVGSSRENAVTALQGAGVQCVIARSFAFIYARNQPNLGMLGITMEDEEFFELAKDGAEIEVDVDGRVIRIGGREFKFNLSELEIQLLQQGGISAAFARWGKKILEKMTASKPSTTGEVTMERSKQDDELQW